MVNRAPPSSYRVVRNLLDLPPNVLNYIIRLALGVTDGELRNNAESLHQTVTLCRTSNSIRVLVTRALSSLNMPDAQVWPNLKSISPSVWPNLRSVNLAVDRSRLISLLTWLAPAVSLKHFSLNVSGAPHAHARLATLERHLLGKMFTSVGPGLETWDLHGLDNHALLISALFHCTSLRQIRFGPSAASDEPRTLISLTVLLALVNQKSLADLSFPKEEWYASMGTPPTAQSVALACRSTWNVLWPAFSAGLKESAVNIPSNESDEQHIVSNFKAMTARLESVNRDMQPRIEKLGNTAKDLVADDPPLALLQHQISSL